MAKVLEQIRNNLVAIVSLAVALTALGYSTWRNEQTERNRNIREAGFELLGRIGSLQQIVLYRQFRPDDPRGEPRMGWAEVLTIVDLAEIMPEPVRRDAKALDEVWEQDVAGLGENPHAHQRIDHAIDVLRQSTLARLRALD